MIIMTGDKSVNICVVSTLPRIVYTLSGRLDTVTYNFEVYSSKVQNKNTSVSSYMAKKGSVGLILFVLFLYMFVYDAHR